MNLVGRMRFIKRGGALLIACLMLVGGYAIHEVNGHQFGIVGQTQKSSAPGCGGFGCHCSSAGSNTTVSLTCSSGSSPFTASPSTSYSFTVTVATSNSNEDHAGINVATYSGTGLTAGSGLYLSSSELTHSSPKILSGGSASWTFTYTSGSSTGWDTIYATGQAVHGSSPSCTDEWNHASKFIIHTVVPTTSRRFEFGRTSMNMGSVRVGTRKADSLHVTSTGQAAITVNASGMKGSAPYTFYSPGTSGRLLVPPSVEMDSVIFQPVSRGTITDSVLFTTNSDTIPDQRKGVFVTGTGIQAVFSNANSSLNFGNLRINQTKKLAFPFYNSGDDTLFISTPTISGSGFTLTQQPHQLWLLPNAYDTVIVQFASTAKQLYSGTLTFAASNGVSAPAISLSGNGVVPQISYTTPQGIGGIRVGSNLAAVINIKNVGNDTLHLSNGSLTQTGTKFSLGAYDATLAPNAQGTIHINYLPTAERVDSATIHVTTDDPTSNFPTITVIGSGLLPHMALADHDTVDMGTIKVSDVTSRLFMINNNGGDVLTLGSGTAAGPAPFGIAAKSSTVSAGGSGSVTVSFVPLAPGNYAGSLVVAGDDPSNPADTIYLKGSAINSSLSLSPSSVDFGSVPVGMTVYDTVLMSNTGTAAVNIAGYHLLSTTAAFIVADSTAKQVKANSTSKVIIGFAPIAATSYTGVLTLSTDDNSAPNRTISLSGTGLKGALSLAPTALAFGNVDSSKSKTLHVTLKNTGSASVSVTSASLTSSGTDFSSNAPATASVKAGDSLGVDITFSPKKAGDQSGTLTFTLDDKSALTVSMTGHGVGKLDTGGVKGAVAQDRGKESFSIMVSPNPAKEVAAIQLQMAATMAATIRIFDASGREVRSTPLGILSAGDHTTEVSVGGLASGSYFVRVENSAGGVSEARLIVQH